MVPGICAPLDYTIVLCQNDDQKRSINALICHYNSYFNNNVSMHPVQSIDSQKFSAPHKTTQAVRTTSNYAIISSSVKKPDYCYEKLWILILGNCPAWCTNSFQCIYLFILLYMFRACHAHQTSLLPTSTRHCHQHGVTFTRSCIDTICFSWWWAWHARNM